MANSEAAVKAPVNSTLSTPSANGGADTLSDAAQATATHGAQITDPATQSTVPEAMHALPLEGVFSWSSYFTAIGTLCILLALLWGLVWVLRKSGKFNFIPRPGGFPRDGLRIEAQLPLGPRKGLTVVRFLDKRLLLGITDHQITLLQEVGDNHDKSTLDFQTIMEKEQQKGNHV